MSSQREVDLLQLRMQRIRRRVDSEVEDLISDAEQIFSWKYYVVRNPIACSVGAALLGYLLVPQKRPQVVSKVYLDPEASQKIVDHSVELHPDAASSADAKSGLLLSLGALGLNMLVKSGISYASRFVKDTMLKEIAGRELPQEAHNRNANV